LNLRDQSTTKIKRISLLKPTPCGR